MVTPDQTRVQEVGRESSLINELPLKKKIADIMRTPPVTCSYLDSVAKIAEIMSERDVSSLVVMTPNGTPQGIITEKDLVKRVLTRDPLEIREMKAHQIMSENLISVDPDDFSYQALLLMAKHSIKHIVVTREETLVGIVTMRDLIRSRQSGALSIVNTIESRYTIEDLSRAVEDIDRMLQALIAERAYASEICLLITEFYDRLTRKIIILAEEEMTAEQGPPPVKFSFVNMGSSGRQEQFSRTDQDNGIIYENAPEGEDPEEIQRYFLALGEKIVDGLALCGFEKCEGLVMASNPEWCNSLSAWCRLNGWWIEELHPENIRKMTIFLDFRHIYGESALTDRLKEFVSETYRTANTALLFLAEDDLRHKAPLNVFRQIVTEKGGEYHNQVNLKGTGSVHIVDCIRLFALQEGIQETSTFGRLKALRGGTVLKDDDIEFIEAAHENLMMFRIQEAARKMSRGEQPNNYINPYLLSKKEQSLLRESFLAVSRLQHLTEKHFLVYKG